MGVLTGYARLWHHGITVGTGQNNPRDRRKENDEMENVETVTKRGKRGSMATVVKDFESGSAVWTFSDGTSIAVGLYEIPEQTRNALALHGLVQKGSDAYAGKESHEAFEAVSTVIEALRQGQFNVGRTGEPRAEPASALANAWFAACQANPKFAAVTFETIQAKVGAMSPADKRKLRTVPEVAVELARAKKSDMTLDSLLG